MDMEQQATVLDRDVAVADLTNLMSKFTSYIGKRLPTDVTQKLGELREKFGMPVYPVDMDSFGELVSASNHKAQGSSR